MKESYLDRIIRRLRERKIVRLIPDNSIVCDLGCGSGKFLYSIAGNIKEGIGIDRDVKSYKIGNITFIKLDLEKKLKLPSNKFNVVTSLAVLEHLNKPESLVKEAFRILKKNGLFIATTPSKLSKSILEFLAFKLHLINEEHIKEHKNYFSREDLRRILKKYGFKNIKISYFEFGMNNIIIAKKVSE